MAKLLAMPTSWLKIIYGALAAISTIFGFILIILLLADAHVSWQISQVALIAYMILAIALLILSKNKLSLASFFILFLLILFVINTLMFMPLYYAPPLDNSHKLYSQLPHNEIQLPHKVVYQQKDAHSPPLKLSLKPLPLKRSLNESITRNITASEIAGAALDWIAFYYNKTMLLNNKYSVKASIELEKGSSIQKYSVSAVPEYKLFSAINGSKYKLSLTNTDDAFDIIMCEGIESEQVFNPEIPAIWVWNVVPKSEGKHNLTLTAFIIVSGKKAEMIEDWPVTVIIKDKNWTDRYKSIKNFWNIYWQWIVGTLITIALGLKGTGLCKWMLKKGKILKRRVVRWGEKFNDR
jgi:hypothetical protein